METYGSYVNSAKFLCLDGGGEEAELGASSHRLLRVRGLGPGVRLTSQQHSIGYNFHFLKVLRTSRIFCLDQW